MRNRTLLGLGLLAAMVTACGHGPGPQSNIYGADPSLPAPDTQWIPRVDIAKASGWPEGVMPQPAEGLEVSEFAGGLEHPRWLYVLPNGDVLVAESNKSDRIGSRGGIAGFFEDIFMSKAGAGSASADRITLLRDVDADGIVDERSVFLDNLHSPFGMALVNGVFYVANTDGIVSVPYSEGALTITEPVKPFFSLPHGAPNSHWTKNIIASPDGKALFAAVGSNSNIGDEGMEKEQGRAAIWRIDIATQSGEVFATGLRNPVGMDFTPATHTLYTVVNERDMLGDNLVPDYLTSVRKGGFYGWPYSYFGNNVDPRVQPQRSDLVANAIIPDYALGAHTASLGLAFGHKATALPDTLLHGAFIGQHGSWNRKPFSGYKVIFIPFSKGVPDDEPVNVLTGFRVGDKAYGRPVGVAIGADGALLVADDVGGKVWRAVKSGAP